MPNTIKTFHQWQQGERAKRLKGTSLGYVRKGAVLVATSSAVIKSWASTFGNNIPCIVNYKSTYPPRDGNIYIELRHKEQKAVFRLQVPINSVEIYISSLNFWLPLQFKEEWEDFFKRMSAYKNNQNVVPEKIEQGVVL